MAASRNGLEIVTLHTGYRFTVGGTMAPTSDGRMLMLTTSPETFGNPGAFRIGRMELWESRDGGRSWDGPTVLHRGSDDRLMLPAALLRLASGRLFLLMSFYGGYDAVTHDPEKSLLEFYWQGSDDNGRTWTAPVRVAETWRYVNCPLAILQLSTGRILIPSGCLTPHHGRSVVSALYSDDQGASWRRSPSVLDIGGEGFESGPCEPTAVELRDGRVWMLMRTQTGFQWESFSDDGGETWGQPRPSRFPSSSAPAVFRRLADGRIVLAWCNSVATPYARHNLSLAASDDDGRTFYGFREIARVEQPLAGLDRRWGIAYPFPCQAPDGTLLVAFNNGDWKHMHVKIARIDPEWLREDSIVDDLRDGVGAWCGVGAQGDSLTPPEDDGPGLGLHIDWVAPGPSGMTRNFPLITRGRTRCAVTLYQGPAYLLWHNSFLDPGRFDEGCLRVRFDGDGSVHVGAGTPTARQTGQANWTPEYSWTAYSVAEEVPYPAKVQPGRRFTLTTRIDAAARTAWVSIDDGPEVARPLGDVLGFCYLGIAVGEAGAIRLRRLETGPSPTPA